MKDVRHCESLHDSTCRLIDIFTSDVMHTDQAWYVVLRVVVGGGGGGYVGSGRRAGRNRARG